MAMVCPKCQAAYEQRLDCPKCNVRLVMRDAPRAERPSGIMRAAAASGQQRLLLVMVVALVLAQGTYYGLRQLVTALLLSLGGIIDTEGWWAGMPGLMLSQAFQALGLLIGGIVVGAGQRWGIAYAAGLGFINGILFLLVQSGLGYPLSAVEWYGQPIVQAAFAAMGGFVGYRIWNPRPVVTGPPSLLSVPPIPTTPPRRTTVDVPVDWVRVIVGVVIAVGGTLWADGILKIVMEASSGTLSVETRFHARFITWEIAQLAVFLGGAWAGANTRDGMRQGWMHGLFTGMVLVTIYLVSQGQYTPAQVDSVMFFGIGIGFLTIPIRNLIVIVFCSMAMGILGGWFGGSLLPPVVSYQRMRGPGPMSG